jgi:hypothetical protein
MLFFRTCLLLAITLLAPSFCVATQFPRIIYLGEAKSCRSEMVDRNDSTTRTRRSWLVAEKIYPELVIEEELVNIPGTFLPTHPEEEEVPFLDVGLVLNDDFPESNSILFGEKISGFRFKGVSYWMEKASKGWGPEATLGFLFAVPEVYSGRYFVADFGTKYASGKSDLIRHVYARVTLMDSQGTSKDLAKGQAGDILRFRIPIPLEKNWEAVPKEKDS